MTIPQSTLSRLAAQHMPRSQAVARQVLRAAGLRPSVADVRAMRTMAVRIAELREERAERRQKMTPLAIWARRPWTPRNIDVTTASTWRTTHANATAARTLPERLERRTRAILQHTLSHMHRYRAGAAGASYAPCIGDSIDVGGCISRRPVYGYPLHGLPYQRGYGVHVTYRVQVRPDWLRTIWQRGLTVADRDLTLEAAPIDAPPGIEAVRAIQMIRARGCNVQLSAPLYFARLTGDRGWTRILRDDLTPTPRRIMACANSDRRRIMLAALPGGLDAVQASCAPKIVDTSWAGRLLRWGYIQMVEVTCPSTGRVHRLRVSPRVISARDAVASTYGLEGYDYYPTAQS